MSSINENIPEGWVETTLGEVSSKMHSGGTPSTKKPEFYGGNIPWIRTQEVTFNFITETEIKITNDGLNKSSAKWIPKDTVIVAMYGNSAGRVALSKIEATTNQACCNFIAHPNVSDSYYIFYNLLSRYKEIEGKANGAAQQNLSVGVLKDLTINLPPLPEQKAIANILTAFDDKIENLQAQNKTLEQTAQTIFKEWFGKYQVGDVLPEGWRFMEFDEVSILSAGGDKPKAFSEVKNKPYSIPIYSNGIKKNGLYGYTDKPKIKEESVTISARGTIGFVCLRSEPYVPIVRLVVAIPKQEFISNKYLYLYLKNMKITGTGTTQQQLTVPAFRKEKILVPNAQKMEEFTLFCNSVFKKIKINFSQIQTLKNSRDILLPKLMSGQLRVNEFKD